MADAVDLGFELLPVDDAAAVDAATALNAATVGALADPDVPAPDVEVPPEPFGRTPLFDFANGRFVRRGGEPVYVTGFEALKQWCLMAANAARYAHPIYSDEFGVEKPNAVLGVTGDEAREAGDDYMLKLRDAWLVHDRVAEVEGRAEFDPVAGVIALKDLAVVTDEEVTVELPDLRVTGVQ